MSDGDETSQPMALDGAGISQEMADEINARFDRGRSRMRRLEEALETKASAAALEANTKLTQVNTDMTREMWEAWMFAKSGFEAIAKVGRGLAWIGRGIAWLLRAFRKAVIWLTPIGIAAGGVWHFFFRDGGKP